MSSRTRSKKQRSQAKRARNGAKAKKRSHAEQLNSLKRWLLPNECIFAGLRRHGNTKWLPIPLVWMALCWCWAKSRELTDRFVEAQEQCQALGFSPVTTYQGMMKALLQTTAPLLPILWAIVQERMQEIGGRFWRCGIWVPIAFDGSRNSVPRTVSAEEANCAPRHGKSRNAKHRKKSKVLEKPQPQIWITLLWHMGLRLPWMWRLGPSNSSERQHVLDILGTETYPKNTLFTGDAGFVGYHFWSQILSRGQNFLVRVGANTRLLVEQGCDVGEGGLVLCWPEEAQKSNLPPLQLRLERIQVGKTWMWMLTSVLDRSLLDQDLMARLYEMRWGIELEFRGLKQTLDRHDLRCRNAERLRVELHWSLLALTVVELFALKEQLAQATGNPNRRSLANAMRALRYSLSHPTDIPAAGDDLCTRLRAAITDGYDRKSSKHARYRPKAKKKPLGDPQVRTLTAAERRKLTTRTPQSSTA